MSLALQSIWKELPQEHINKAVANFTKRSTACVAANIGYFEARSSAVRVHFQVYILISAPKRAFFRATHILPEKTTSEMLKTGNYFSQGNAETFNTICDAY